MFWGSGPPHGIRVFNLTEVEEIPVYIDGADEITRSGAMIKGGGGALTREKIIASAAARFICIADESKLVATLGKFPLPVEVIPMAYKLVAGKLDALGARAELRIRDGKPFVTDNGNLILDVFGLQIGHPLRLEEKSTIPPVSSLSACLRKGAPTFAFWAVPTVSEHWNLATEY